LGGDAIVGPADERAASTTKKDAWLSTEEEERG
jgi:hypothetical protein